MTLKDNVKALLQDINTRMLELRDQLVIGPDANIMSNAYKSGGIYELEKVSRELTEVINAQDQSQIR